MFLTKKCASSIIKTQRNSRVVLCIVIDAGSILDKLHSVYVVGDSRTNADNAITKNYGAFFVAFEVDDDTYRVLDFNCTHTLDITQVFLRKLFVGHVFPSIDEWIEDELNRRYGGASRKAVLVAYRDALKRWKQMTKVE